MTDKQKIEQLTAMLGKLTEVTVLHTEMLNELKNYVMKMETANQYTIKQLLDLMSHGITKQTDK